MASEADEMGGARRWPRRLGKLFLFVGLVSMLAIWSGKPQEWGTRYAVRTVLGAEAEVDWEGTLGAFRIAELRLKSQDQERPFAVARDVVVDYALLPGDGRFVRSVSVGSLSLVADASDPEHPNYQFLLDYLAAREDTGSTWTPKTIVIETLVVEAIGPDGLRANAGGLKFRGEMVSSTSGSVLLSTSSLTTAFTAQTPGGPRTFNSDEGRIQAAFEYSELDVSGRIEFDVAGYGEGDFTVTLDRERDMLGLAFERFEVGGPEALKMVAAYAPVDTTFGALRFDGTWLEAPLAQIAEGLPEGELHLAAEGLILGTPGHELYRGELNISGRMEREEASGIFEISTDGGSVVHLAVAGDAENATCEVAFSDWTKEDLVSVLPTDLRAYFEEADLRTAAGSLELIWSSPKFEVNARIESSGAADGDTPPLYLSMHAKGSTEADSRLEGNLDAWFGEGRVDAVAFFAGAGDYRADVTFEQVRIGPWLELAGRGVLPEGVEATLDGTIGVNADLDDAEWLVVQPELLLSGVRVGDALDLGGVRVSGMGRVNPSSGLGTVAEFAIEQENRMSSLRLMEWEFDREAGSANGHWTGSLDLDLLDGFEEFEAAVGEVFLEGSASMAGSRLSVPIAFRSDYLGYGDLLLPYGTEMTGGGVVEFDSDTKEGAFNSLVVQLGEGTSLRSEEIVFTLEPFTARGTIREASDLQLAVAMGNLESADGTVETEASVEYGEDGLRATWLLTMQSEGLELPDDAGSARGLMVNASGRYDGLFHGSGTLGALAITGAGATMHAIEGDFEIAESIVTAPAVTSRLFQGTMTSRVEMNIAEEDLPILLESEFTGIDLEVLTEEVEPPSVELTGLANGRLSLQYGLGGLTSFSLDAKSTEHFSLNRSMVEQVLQTEKLLGGLGAKKADKTLAKFLGSAPQRPFDSASMNIHLVGELITGYSELLSEKTEAYNGLNLRITVDIDKPALAQSLQLLEESGRASVDF